MTESNLYSIKIQSSNCTILKVSANTQKDLLIGYSGLQVVADVLECGLCSSPNVHLRQFKGTNDNISYSMGCKKCGAVYSFSVNSNAPNTLLENFNKDRKGWRMPEKQEGNNTYSRPTQTNVKTSQVKQQQPLPKQEDDIEDNDCPPF